MKESLDIAQKRCWISLVDRIERKVYAVCCEYTTTYPFEIMRILLDHYNEEQKVRELISFGNIKALDENILLSDFYHRDHKERLQIICSPYSTTRLSYLCEEFRFYRGRWEMNWRDGWKPITELI